MDWNILALIIFVAVSFLIAFLWDRKINNEKKYRSRGTEKLFFIIFGVTATFIAIDNWLTIQEIIPENTKKIASGLGKLYSWWGILAFIIGIFLGMIVLFLVYKRMIQNVKRFNIVSVYHFLKMRYSKTGPFIRILSYVSTFIFIPLIFYQIKIVSVFLFPQWNSYLALIVVSIAFILLFLFISGKDYKLPYLLFFTLFIIWFILGIQQLPTQTQVYFDKPDISIFLTIIFLGICYYTILPRNFAAYTNRKIDTLKIGTLTKSLFLGSLIFLILLFYLMPIGGWKLEGSLPSAFFMLILSFTISIPQLFVVKTTVYQSFKKYTPNSKNTAGFIASGIFLLIILLANFVIETVGKNSALAEKIDYSRLFFLSLTYIPILFPSFIGGFVFTRAKSISFLFSVISGFIVWFYLNIFEDFLGFTIFSDFNLSINPLTQVFLPFLTACLFYILPFIFSKKVNLMALGLTDPEEVIIESFLVSSTDNPQFQVALSDADHLAVFMVFFDNPSKFFNLEFLAYRTKIAKTKIVQILEKLEKANWIYRDNQGFYTYQKQEEKIEQELSKLITSYHTLNSIFRKKVEEDFEEYKRSIINKANEMENQVSTISLLNEVSVEFSKIFKFSTLYRKVAELCVKNLEFECAEIFLVQQKDKDSSYYYKPVSLFYSNFRHLIFSIEEYEKTINEDSVRKNLFETVFKEKELIINNPKEIEEIKSLPEKYSAIALIPVYQEEKPFAIIQVGYITEDKTIGSQDKQKIDFLLNNLSQNIIIISLYESLEEKINQRTAELQKTNEELQKFNNELNHLNKEIKREMMAASAIQKAMFPEVFPYPQYVEVGAFCKAMPDETLTEQERKRIEISGDYYDVFDLGDNKIGILIADVTGHGIPSALITTMAKISFYTHSFAGGTTADICARVNKDIYEAIGVGDTGFYVTVFFCIYDTQTGKLQFTNAGHHEGLLIRKGASSIETLNSEGFFIGSFDGATYGYNETVLQEGDKLILYTDGIVELRNPDGVFYEDIFYKRILELSSEPSKKLAQIIFKEIEEFRKDAPIKDDRTLVIMEAKKIPNPAPFSKEEKSETIVEQENKTQDKIQEIKNRYHQVMKEFKNKNYSPEIEKEIDFLIPKIKNPHLLYYAKGVILTKRENFNEALQFLKKAYELSPENVDTINYLAFCHFKLKNYPEAKKLWEKALEINPNLKSVSQNLEVLKKLL